METFALLLPTSFQCSLLSPPDIPPNSYHLELPLADVSLLQNFQAGHSKFKDAMALFQKQNQTDMEEE